jgi:hypothetical protein
MIGNFNPGYIKSCFYPAGYFDIYNVDSTSLTETENLNRIKLSRKSLCKTGQTNVFYDLLFKPPSGLLNSKKPLIPKTEMIISFDRAPSELALINEVEKTESTLDGKAIELKNVFMRASYYSSPYLRNYFDKINSQEISYKYDECQVLQKSLPTGLNNIRLANLIGGNTPKYLFAGIIESASLSGDIDKCSTAFKHHGVTEFDLTLDGYSVNGFPITSEDESPLNVYDQFLRTTNRKFDNLCGAQIEPEDFQLFHYIYAHKFCGETSETGWIGVNLKLEKAYTQNYTLGILIIYIKIF